VPGLALAVVAIALPDSLNPSLIAAAAYLALGPHPFRRTLAFTIAAFVVTLLGATLVALGLGDLVVSLLPTLSRSLKWRLLAVLGVALAIGGVVLWFRRDSLAGGEPPSHRKAPSGSAIVMGGGIAGVEFLTAFPYFAAIALVVGSSESSAGKAFLIVLYDVVYILPLVAIVVACGLLGDRAGRSLAPVADWISTRWPIVVAPLATAAGVGLTAYAVAQLV
jgi:cytochrome c biogenesis protein CcdA